MPSPATQLATTCPSCHRPLLVRYELPTAAAAAELRDVWASRPPDMWRFREILPIGAREAPISLSEGGTPLVPMDARAVGLAGLHILVKDEGRNPTGSFKDRGLAAAVTRAVHDGARALVIPSAGNAGVSLAAYAARAGVGARIFIPRDTPGRVVRRCELYGAEVELVDGLISECGRLAHEHAVRSGAFDVSTLREPYRIEGKKTMMLEIVQTLGGQAPEAVVYPTGGGTGLIGSWKALAELRALGLVTGATRLYSVQAGGCAPIVRAWKAGEETAAAWETPRTIAYGLRVPTALGDFLILRAIRESGGAAVAVEDAEMQECAQALGLQGISASIEGGATLAAARALWATGQLKTGERVVLFNTGNGLTY